MADIPSHRIELFAGDPGADDLRILLNRELGPEGTSLDTITQGLQGDAAAQLRTRIRSLLADVIGVA